MRRLGMALPILLAGCVAPRQPAPPPPPAPRPAPPPAPAPAPVPEDWRDRAYTPGDWSYARSDGYSEAAYGAPGAPRVFLRCETATRQIRLGWPGLAADTITFTSSYGDTARAAQAGAAGAELLLSTRDPLLDQLAYSRGRFRLAVQGQELILPSWPEVARLVEDCR